MTIKNRRAWLVWVTAAAAVILTGVLMVERLNLFCFERAAFDRVVAALPPPTKANDWRPVDVPAQIGSCEVTSAYAVKGGYIFYATHGLPTFDDTGFGYFPDGPTDDLENGAFESPRFRHIEGPWYDWTASW